MYLFLVFSCISNMLAAVLHAQYDQSLQVVLQYLASGIRILVPLGNRPWLSEFLAELLYLLCYKSGIGPFSHE